jgi:hypothetical protein
MIRGSARIAARIASMLVGLLLTDANAADLRNSEVSLHSIQIDGLLNEWDGFLTPFQNGKLSLAAANGQGYLYLGIAVSDLSLQREILSRGLFIYLDADGGRDRSFGIRYPLGLEEMGLRPERPERSSSDPEFGPPEPGRERIEMDPGQLQELYDGVSPELELIDGDYSSHRLSSTDTLGIQVSERYRNGIFTYEICIPLQKDVDAPFAMELGQSRSIDIGLITPKLEPGHRRGAAGDRSRGGGGGGIRGPGGGGGVGGAGRSGGGRPGGFRGRGDMPQPLELWIEYKLAE